MAADGRTVLVLGGSGQVGAPIVQALLDDGARVTVPSRGPDRARDTLGEHERLLVVEGDVSSHDGAVALRDHLVDEGWSPTDVVASIGSWWQGDRVAELDPGEWQRVQAQGIGAHFHAANTFLPALLEADAASTYLLVNGSGAEEPIPGSSAVNVSAAAQLMLGRVLAAEHADDDGLAVATLVIETPVVSRDRPEGRKDWLRAEDIADVVVAILAGRATDDVVRLADRDAPTAFLDGS